MDPRWLITKCHGQLVDVRVRYEELFAGGSDYRDLLVKIDELRWMVKELRKAVPSRVRKEAKLRQPKRVKHYQVVR